MKFRNFLFYCSKIVMWSLISIIFSREKMIFIIRYHTQLFAIAVLFSNIRSSFVNIFVIFNEILCLFIISFTISLIVESMDCFTISQVFYMWFYEFLCVNMFSFAFVFFCFIIFIQIGFSLANFIIFLWNHGRLHLILFLVSC